MVCYLRNPSAYKSVSAFSPIVNPCNTGFGKKNFNNYLNDPAKEGPAYDTLCILESLSDSQRLSLEMLIDQGTHDHFNAEELQLEKLETLVRTKGFPGIKILQHAGYDHSFFFVSSFIEKHVAYHAKKLNI